MIKEICTDEKFLSLPSIEASKEDKSDFEDLLDTLKFHQDHCLGMALNMIGINKCIIAINNKGELLGMYNPQIIKTSPSFQMKEEGCLSLLGVKKVKRFTKIQVSYFDKDFKKKIQTFSNLEAEIVQHELDHLQGILI